MGSAASVPEETEPLTDAPAAATTDPASLEASVDASASHVELMPASFDALPSSTELAAFSLVDSLTPQIPRADADAIQQALDQVHLWGNAGAALVDLATGRGICLNVDAQIYGASSFKLPYALYVCESQVETGSISLDSAATTFPSGVSIPVDGASSWARAATHPVLSLIEAAVVNSDNDAFGILRNNYDARGFDAWVTNLGAADCVYRYDSWYPWYCTRSSLKLWCEAWRYFEGGTDAASWLSGLTARTATSFLRDALGTVGATVRDKAGWIATSDPSLCAVVDAGIVEIEGASYLMSIMTGMPDSAETRGLFGNLARALFDARDALA